MDGVKTFLRDDRGSQTVQFVVWFPIWFVLIVVITDASLLYYAHTEMSTVARDTARRLTSGALPSVTDAQDYAFERLGNLSYRVNVEYDTATTMAVQISVPVGEVIPFGGFIDKMLPPFLTTRVAMRSEPNIFASAGGSGGGSTGGSTGGGGNGGGKGG